jgi:integrase
LRDAPKDSPRFRSAARKTGRLTGNAMTALDLCRMVKRRLEDAGLPGKLTCHSFRVATITDLLEQGVLLEDVQRLAGPADPRTTRLYDRRPKHVTRTIVERISMEHEASLTAGGNVPSKCGFPRVPTCRRHFRW